MTRAAVRPPAPRPLAWGLVILVWAAAAASMLLHPTPDAAAARRVQPAGPCPT